MNAAKLTAEQARARFDAALDGELDAEERARFEAALADDAELRDEYERQRSVLAATKLLAQQVPSVDLLSSVQHKLRARSGGRFYRDRFSERRTTQASLWVVMAISAAFVLATLGWFAYQTGWFGQSPTLGTSDGP